MGVDLAERGSFLHRYALFQEVIPLEIASAFVKPFALAMRLFANMIAGHVVIAVLLIFAAGGLAAGGVALGISAVSVLGAVFINLLELLVEAA